MPATLATQSASDKPRVYLVYNLREREDKINAGQIIYHFKNEFHFDLPDDPAQHTARLAGSDGVLLVWGNTEEEWCAPEFESMIQVSRRARAKGLCLFDPQEKKVPTVDLIRRGTPDVYVVEEFHQPFAGCASRLSRRSRQNVCPCLRPHVAKSGGSCAGR